jgi:voltage-gated potassium channel
VGLTLHEAAKQSGRVIYLEVLVLVLSLYSVAALALELLVPLDPDTLALLARADDLVCVVFLTDFFVHWSLAPSRRAYLRVAWIDLLSSIPQFGWLRWGRVFRVFRILRALRSFHAVYAHFRSDRTRGAFAAVGLLSVIAVLFATIAVFELERNQPEANIHTGGDALWWAFATITTIGYGDRFPVTAGGRAVAVVLVIFGLSFFGTFTAYVASYFLEKTQLKEESEIHRLIVEVRQLREEVNTLALRLGDDRREIRERNPRRTGVVSQARPRETD